MNKKPIQHYEIYKYIPPDRHEFVTEVNHAKAAQWKVYQLDTLLTREDRRSGVFHYRWLRFHTSEGQRG